MRRPFLSTASGSLILRHRVDEALSEGLTRQEAGVGEVGLHSLHRSNHRVFGPLRTLLGEPPLPGVRLFDGHEAGLGVRDSGGGRAVLDRGGISPERVHGAMDGWSDEYASMRRWRAEMRDGTPGSSSILHPGRNGGGDAAVIRDRTTVWKNLEYRRSARERGGYLASEPIRWSRRYARGILTDTSTRGQSTDFVSGPDFPGGIGSLPSPDFPTYE